MRGIPIFVVGALLVASCGVPEEGSLGLQNQTAEGHCQRFIDETEPLPGLSEYAVYVDALATAALPLIEFVWDLEPELSQDTMMSLEDIGFGEPDLDDLAAFDEVGALFASDEGTICEELSRNLGFMPPPPGPGWDTPPEVVVESVYPEGSVDYACDVFVQTMNAWLGARTSGQEVGVAIADLADEMIGRLEANGISDGLADLRTYSDKYRNLPIAQAGEEAEQYLSAASQQLASHSEVCGHLSTWGFDGATTADLSYHIDRWGNYGFNTYHYRLVVGDEDIARGQESYVVVVEDGKLSEVFNIRTAQPDPGPDWLPLAISDLFEFIEGNPDVTSASFHPVLGHPRSLDVGPLGVSIFELVEGADFDKSVLGSTADLSLVVEAIDEFLPGKACGHVRVGPGLPILEPTPLDDDAQQAVDVLAANAEGERFVDDYEFGIASRTEDRLILLGISDSGTYSDAAFVRIDGLWDPTGWGTCHWTDDGYSEVPWDFDPEATLDLAGSEIELLVHDDCGTTTDHGHEMFVVAEFSDEEVSLVVWQSKNPPPPPPGSEEAFRELSCPLGVVVQLTVLLEEPVGERSIVGSTPPEDWSDY